jgi:hypothetical protein
LRVDVNPSQFLEEFHQNLVCNARKREEFWNTYCKASYRAENKRNPQRLANEIKQHQATIQRLEAQLQAERTILSQKQQLATSSGTSPTTASRPQVCDILPELNKSDRVFIRQIDQLLKSSTRRR